MPETWRAVHSRASRPRRLNTLAKRRGEHVAALLRRAADDVQPEVRIAVIEALAELPEPSHDGILERSTRSARIEERRRAHVARVRANYSGVTSMAFTIA